MTTKRILDFYASVETVITQLVRLIVSVTSFSISELAPLVAPLAPSFSIYLAMSQRLHMPTYIALIAAGTIEIVGMYSAKISVRAYRWNSTRNKSEARVPQGLSMAMTGIFFTVVLALALTIELIPSLTALIFPAFTLISVSVYINMAIDQNLRKLETDKADDLAERRVKTGLNAEIKKAKDALIALAADLEKMTLARSKLTSELEEMTLKRSDEMNRIEAQKSHFPPSNEPGSGNLEPNFDRANESRRSKVSDRHQAIVSIKADEPEITQADLAGRLNELGYDVSLSTVKRDIKSLNGSLKAVT